MAATEAASTEEIDVLLAQADSLMAEMADSLGEQQPEQPDSPPADEPAAAQADAGNMGVAEAIAEEDQAAGEPSARQPEPSGEAPADQAEPSVETAPDPEASVSESPELETAGPTKTAQADPATQPDADSTAEGPQSPPPDLLAEADINNLAETVNEPLPQIRETLTSEEAPACEKSAPQPASASRILPRAAAAVAHVPIDLLILLDRPFSRLNAGAKTFLGYAAIGTLIVGLATWLLGTAQAAN